MLNSVMIGPVVGTINAEFGRRGHSEQRSHGCAVAVGHVRKVDRDGVAVCGRSVQDVGELVDVGQVDVAGRGDNRR